MILFFLFCYVIVGFVVVVVGYSSVIVIVIDLVWKVGVNDDMIISWLLVLGLGMGVFCIIFFWLIKMFVVMVWFILGVVFLIGNVGDYILVESIGVFVVCVLFLLVIV